MSDQLSAASQAMKVPEPLVERSARARAEATGASYEEILAAWAGGEAVADAPPPSEPAPEAADDTEPEPTPDAAPEEAEPVAPQAPAQPAVAAFQAPVEELDDEPVEPLPLPRRVRSAGRIGAWTGAGLGLVGFVVASTWLHPAASVAGEEGAFSPAVEVMSSRMVLGAALMSIVFGIVVAALSRAGAAWVDPGARLDGRAGVTVLLGAVVGLVLGVAAGAVMVSAFSVPVEGAEGMVVMQVVPALAVVLAGGALLGFLTAALVQVLGVPVGIDDESAEEIHEVRTRLSAALSIPVAAVVLLALFVIPLGITFVRSNELASGGAAALAVLASAGILGFATLSASRPTMRISFGEFLVAAAGIATVVLIIFAVFSSRAEPEEHAEEGETGTEEEEPAEGSETTVPAETTTPEAGAFVVRL
jgi:hypothetical protein